MTTRFARRLAACAGLACLAAEAPARAAGYDFTPFAIPGAIDTTADGINDSGQVAGSYLSSSFQFQGFVDTAGSVAPVAVPGAGFTSVYGISNSGLVAGGYSTGFLAGSALAGAPAAPATFAASGAAMTSALGVNSAGTVVGAYGTGTENMGFVYQGGVLTPVSLPGVPLPAFLNANGINDSGAVVGAYGSGGAIHGFLLAGGGFTQIDVPGAYQTYAQAINGAGEIAGFYDDSSFHSHGFLDDNGVFTTVDYAGGPGNTQLYGINDAGDVVGTYTAPMFAFSLSFTGAPASAVPEPASLVLLGAGAAAAGAARRRRHADRRAMS